LRKRLIIVVVSIFLMLCFPKMFLILEANPIPVPTLIMEREYITVILDMYDEAQLNVTVVGLYPFINKGYENITMFFPVPPEALRGNITVLLGKRKLYWNVTSQKYSTILGDYPVIAWSLAKPPDKFNITVVYWYLVPLSKGGFRTLYAMATGRFLKEGYSKQCIAEVTFVTRNLPEDWKIRASFVPPPSEVFMAGFESQVEALAGAFNGTVLKKASKPFHGMENDLLIEVEASGPEKWIPYTPTREEFSKWSVVKFGNGTVEIELCFVFRNSGYSVKLVGSQVQENQLILDLKVLRWTGPSLQVITYRTVKARFHSIKGAFKILVRVNGKNFYTIPLNQEEKTKTFSHIWAMLVENIWLLFFFVGVIVGVLLAYIFTLFKKSG